MIDLTGVAHHPALEEIVEVLCNKTQNTDKGFFRVETAYFLSKMASCQRATVITKDRGDIPVNSYVLALASSGYGKGHSVNMLETDFLGGFKRRFLEDTLPTVAEKNLWTIANKRAVQQAIDPQESYDKVAAEYRRTGAYPFTFDSGTPPAVKQLRHKLLMAAAGSINLQIDEIGSNLLGNIDVLTVFLELYDQGIVKPKLTKNTAENERNEDLDGKTPTNMLLFGTPTKLLDGGQTEDEFYSFLETGYARRCLFGWGHQNKKAAHQLPPAETYKRLIDPANTATVTKWATHFTGLADPAMFNWQIEMDDEVAIQLLEYRLACERAADKLADHEEIRKAELNHRYFKALKLAGTYAFIDACNEVEMEHLKQAILLVEESGQAFQQILNREKAYVKLAKYISTCNAEVTHADLVESLPFYKSGNGARNEMMTLATAWGYKHNIIIKKNFVDGIEFFKGETLAKTDLAALTVSYSDHWAYNYQPDRAPFDQLHLLTQQPGMHWANHHFRNEHRADENVIPGFDLVVLDVDQGTPLATACELLKEYRFFVHTTKRHTDQANRFRLVLPIAYRLELDIEEYKEFMQNVMGWLPFPIDDGSRLSPAAKWASCETGKYFYNQEGEVLDPLPFIPKTAKNEQYQAGFKAIESLSNLERWFAGRIAVGNRNNNMLRYAMALVDGGLSLVEVSTQVHAFNDKLSSPLRKDEINGTILKSVARRYQKQPKP